MPIRITCPGCHTRFSVAEKYAGQKGPCPKCKEVITIPKPEDEVVIHSPEHSEAGAIGVGGRHVLKTYKRKDTKFAPLLFATVAVAVLIALLVAIVLRNIDGQPTIVFTAVAAIVLGPPLAWAGYTFLRDDELQGYEGQSLIIRSVACGLVYALLWAIYVFVGSRLFGADAFSRGLEIYQMVVLAGLVLGCGTLAAYVSFDLEPGSAFFHTAMYFSVTVLLRLVAGLPAIPGLGAS